MGPKRKSTADGSPPPPSDTELRRAFQQRARALAHGNGGSRRALFMRESTDGLNIAMDLRQEPAPPVSGTNTALARPTTTTLITTVGPQIFTNDILSTGDDGPAPPKKRRASGSAGPARRSPRKAEAQAPALSPPLGDSPPAGSPAPSSPPFPPSSSTTPPSGSPGPSTARNRQLRRSARFGGGLEDGLGSMEINDDERMDDQPPIASGSNRRRG